MSETTRTQHTPRVGDLPMVPAYTQTAITIVWDNAAGRTLAVWGDTRTGVTRPGRVLASADGMGPDAIAQVASEAAAILGRWFS